MFLFPGRLGGTGPTQLDRGSSSKLAGLPGQVRTQDLPLPLWRKPQPQV